MDIETAEKIISEQSLILSNATDKCSRHPMVELLVAAKTIIAARDQRIAELNSQLSLKNRQVENMAFGFNVLVKERDEARRDAYIASNISKEYIEKYCYKIHSEPFEVCNSEFVTVDRIIEKYKDTK